MATLDNNLRGIVAIVAAQVAFLLNDTLVKLVGDRLPVGEMIVIRGGFAVLFVGAFVVALGQHRDLATLRNGRVPLRVLAEVGGTLFYLLALLRMPIANVIIIFQAVPLVATAAAALFLGERVGWHRWLAIVVGFLGVMLVLRPGLGTFEAAGLLVLVSVLFISARDIVTRTMPATISTLLMTWVTALAVTLLGLVLGLGEDWVVPAATDALALALAAILLAAGYFTAIRAMRFGDMSVTAPFRYVAVVLAIALGYLVWGDVPDILTIVGSMVIIAAGLYTLMRERRSKAPSGQPAGSVPASPPQAGL